MYRAACLVMLLGLSTGAIAGTYDYEVYVAGARAGEVRISVAQQGPQYQVAGVLRSVGLFDWLTAWRGRFQGEGEVRDGVPVLTHYLFSDRDRQNARYVQIADGVLTQVKNGRVRAPRLAPTAADLFSTFVLPQGCLTRTAVHLAKASYVMDLESTQPDELTDSGGSRFSGAALQCRYQVEDEDSTAQRATVWVAIVDGLSVPVRIEFDGAVKGGIYLI